MSTLQRLARGRTVIAVTHRLSTVADNDQIFVLDGSRLIEQGSHEALLRGGGAYQALWQKQHGFSVTDDGSRAMVEPERLRAISIFEQLPEEVLVELADRLTTENVPENRLVIQEGDSPDKFYVIVRGTVAVSSRDEAGNDHRLRVLQDGDHFGELALLNDGARPASVNTLTPCVFLSLQRGQFNALLERVPNLRPTLESLHQHRLAASGRSI